MVSRNVAKHGLGIACLSWASPDPVAAAQPHTAVNRRRDECDCELDVDCPDEIVDAVVYFNEVMSLGSLYRAIMARRDEVRYQ